MKQSVSPSRNTIQEMYVCVGLNAKEFVRFSAGHREIENSQRTTGEIPVQIPFFEKCEGIYSEFRRFCLEHGHYVAWLPPLINNLHSLSTRYTDTLYKNIKLLFMINYSNFQIE